MKKIITLIPVAVLSDCQKESVNHFFQVLGLRDKQDSNSERKDNKQSARGNSMPIDIIFEA